MLSTEGGFAYKQTQNDMNDHQQKNNIHISFLVIRFPFGT